MAEKRTESLEFRNLNPMDVSLPTVSPKFGEAVGKAMSDFGRTVQQGVLDYARVAKQQEEDEAVHGITKEYIKASADRNNFYEKNHQGGKIEGQLLSKDYETWSDEWLTTRTKGLSTQSQLKVRRSLESRMGNDYARLVPKQQKYAQIKFLADNEKRNMALSNSLLSMSPDLAYEEVAEMIGDNEKIMEESAGTIFSPDQAAEQTVKFNNQVAVNSLENFVNNKRPELIIDALAPYLESDEAKEFLESKGLSREELGVEPGPSIIDENVTPQQKSAYLRKAFALMEEQDQINDSILKDRISNFMTAQKVGNISEGQSLSEFMAIEKELMGKNSFGKDRFPPNFVANKVLQMTGAHVSRVSQNRIPHTPNGSLAVGLGNIKKIAENHANELKERYKDNPAMLEYLDTPTLKDGLQNQALADYSKASQNAYKERIKDSAAYLQKNDKEVAAATEGLFQELGVSGAPDPQRLNEYIKMVRTRADNLGIPREAQTILSDEVINKIANTAMELRDKFSPTGVQYSALLEDLKAGVPDEDWPDFKDDLKEKGLKDADFFAVDNFNPQSASYWQRLNNPDIQEGLKQTAKANPELSDSKVIAKLQDRGYGIPWGRQFFGNEAVFEGPLATTSPIGRALLGPGGEIRNQVMHDRITEMAINSVRWEVGQGKDVDDAFEEATKRIEQAFPTVQGKYGTIIVSGMEGMENPEYAKNTLKNFLKFEHRVSDYESNFVNHPDIQKALKTMNIVSPHEQSEYLDENYRIEWANAGEGRMSAYLINKNDKTSIPFEINDADGRPVPLEMRLNADDIQKKHSELLRSRDLSAILKPSDRRSPGSVDPMTISPDMGTVEGTTPMERFRSVMDLTGKGEFASYDQEEYLYRLPEKDKKGNIVKGAYWDKRKKYAIKFKERGKTEEQIESRKTLLGMDEENMNSLYKAMQDPASDPMRRQLFKKIIETGIPPTPTERIKLKTALLYELGQIAGNIPREIIETVNPEFSFRLNDRMEMYLGGKQGTPLNFDHPTLGSAKGRNAWKWYDSTIKYFSPSSKGNVNDKSMRVLLETEAPRHEIYDSPDNVSGGSGHVAVHETAALAEVVDPSSNAHKFFKKQFPLYVKDLQGVDKMVLANNHKLNLAIMYSFMNGSVYPKLDRYYSNKKWKPGEKDFFANMAYNSGASSKANIENNIRKKWNKWDGRYVKAMRAFMPNVDMDTYQPFEGRTVTRTSEDGLTKSRAYRRGKNRAMRRTMQSTEESTTFNEPTATANIEELISEAMDKINGRLEEILGGD